MNCDSSIKRQEKKNENQHDTPTGSETQPEATLESPRVVGYYMPRGPGAPPASVTLKRHYSTKNNITTIIFAPSSYKGNNNRPLINNGTRLSTVMESNGEVVVSKIHKWWRCSGGLLSFVNRIDALQMEVETYPFINRMSLYYLRQCQQAFYKLFFPDLSPSTVEFKPMQIEQWKDYATGIHGMLDFNMTLPNGTVLYKTMEFDDDELTHVNVKLIDEYPAVKQKSRVVFITPIFNRTEAFFRNLKSVKGLAKEDENFAYCYADFDGDDLEIDEQLDKLLDNDTRNIEITVIKFDKPFRKAPALQACIDVAANSDDIVFIMDVDVTFAPVVLERVRRYAIQGKRIFSPIVWYTRMAENGTEFPHAPQLWATQGTGILALYKSDIERFGGYDLDLFQDKHGFEDTDFFFSTRYLRLQIARAKEPSLVHLPHPRDGWEKASRKDLLDCENES